MRKTKIRELKKALGYKGRLSVVEKSFFRSFKREYNKLNKDGRLAFLKLMRDNLGKSKEENKSE